ncbi:MAG: glycosyltransferase family 39 protein [Gemmatimonadota bacterium]|nr:glycosyltransferase family 39 protein [Gemmatimonadota bacterium]
MVESRTRDEWSPRNERILWALVAIGVALRTWQYLSDTSMWFDELSIARNITERSFGQLLSQPLGFQQTAPIGFLAMLKITSKILGPSDLALRLFPFLCGIASVFVFCRVARRTLSGSAVPIAVAIFALSPPLIRYSAELKQYGCDVLAILVLTLVGLSLCTRTPTVRECVRAGLIGAFTILFSQAAVLVLAGIGAALTLRFALRWRELPRRVVLVTVPIWACAAVIGLVMARHYMTAHTIEFMHWFWRTRLGFLPLPTSASGFALWTRDRFTQFFDAMSGYPVPLVYTLLCIAGFVVLWRRREVALILLGPIAVTFAAAVAQQYPFRMRVVLFLLPSLLIATAAAMGWIIDRLYAFSRPLGAGIAVAAMVPPLLAIGLTPPPYTAEPFKPILAYVQAHRQRGDRIYVYSNAFQAITRYGPQYGMPVGSYDAGTCDETTTGPYLTEVDRYRGAHRLWVIASSVPDFRPPRRAIGKYLRTIGVVRDSIQRKSVAPLDPVSAELFDLSDTARLRSATAATFTAKADTLHPLCFDWVYPTPADDDSLPR